MLQMPWHALTQLQALLDTSEKEKVDILARWTAVEQQRQNAEKQVSELQVCWCVCVCARLPPVCLSSYACTYVNVCLYK